MEKWNCWLKESKLWATFLDFHYAKRLWRVTRNHKDMKLTDISLAETCPLSQLCLCTENPSLPTYLSMWNEKSDSYSNGVFHVWAFISVKIFPLAAWIGLNFPYCTLLGKWIVSKEEWNKIYSGTNVTSLSFTDQPPQCCHGIVTLLPGDKGLSLWSSISV